MSTKKPALLWIDHHEARIIRSTWNEHESVEVDVLRSGDDRTHDRKHDGGHRHVLSTAFADRVAGALRGHTDLIVSGPSTAKDEVMVHLRERHADVAGCVRKIETLDRATDPQLAEHARGVFEAVDHMRGVHVPRSGH
jgi:hypothetical protein